MSEHQHRAEVSVRPITIDDAAEVSQFLHAHLNARVPAARWRALVEPTWGHQGPNHGFALVDSSGDVVGVYVAVYSTRDGGATRVCNLAAYCVLEAHRGHSLRLLRELLRQKDHVFTDLSPSGSVPALNERLGFQHLNVATRLVLARPGWARHVTLTTDRRRLEATLVGEDAGIFADHESAAGANHLLVQSGDRHAYLMYRRERRKRLRLFASAIHVGGDRRLLESAWPAVAGHLLSRGIVAFLAERRVLGFVPPGPGHELTRPRPRMYRGALPPHRDVDYLYSELALVEW